MSLDRRVKNSLFINGSDTDNMTKYNSKNLLKFVTVLLLISFALNSTACTQRPPLQNEEWIYLSDEQRRSVFESILREPDKPANNLKYLYISIGGIIAFFGLGAAFEGKKEKGIFPWLAFGSSFGILWTGMGALIQKNYIQQRKRIALRELNILDHPEWREDKIRAIRDGRIDIGYEDDMAIAAWGIPQQKIHNVSFNGKLYEEWTYIIKNNTKLFIDSDRKIAIIQTSEMTYFTRASQRSKDIK